MVRLPILALLAAVALAAGCGGGEETPEGVPPADWAQSVCGALSDWQTSLLEQSQGLTSEVLEAKNPQAAKQQIGDFLGDVIADTEIMVGIVEDSGVPAVEEGGQVAADFRAGLNRMRSAFQDAQQRVESVPTDDPEAFQEQLARIGADLQTQGKAIGDTLSEVDEKYDAEELSQAFDNTPQCQDFVEGSG
jgi:hypothetical protein